MKIIDRLQQYTDGKMDGHTDNLDTWMINVRL